MTSKKKATAKKKTVTKAEPKVVALSREQKLAIIEEAIDRLPEVGGWSTVARELREFAAWWRKHGIIEAIQFHEEQNDKDYFWHCTFNYPNGQPAGGITIEHFVAVDKPSLPKFGGKFIDSVEYHLEFPAEGVEARRLLFKVLKDWRRTLKNGQKTDTKKKSPPDSSRPIPLEAWTAFNYRKQMKKDGRKCTKDQALDYAIGPNCRKGRAYLKKQMKRCETAKPPRKKRTKSGL